MRTLAFLVALLTACGVPAPSDGGTVAGPKTGFLGGVASGGTGAGGGLTAVTTSARFTGSGSNGSPLELAIAGDSCTTGQATSAISAVGAGTCTTLIAGSSGDLTAFTGANAIGNYAGSTPSACTTGQATTGPALTAAGALTNACTTLISGTNNTLTKFTGTNTIGNATPTDDGTTFAVGAGFSVTESTGATSSNTSFTAPRVIVNGTTAATSEVVHFTGTAQTTSKGPLSVDDTGTYNTTSGALSAQGLLSSVTSTRSAGANNLSNVGIQSSASGAQINDAALFSGGNVNLSAGHLVATGTAPTPSSCGATPSPTVTGSDIAGVLTTGGTATACTLTFAATFTNEPSCIVLPMGSATMPVYTVSATAIAITTDIAQTKYHYQCIGLSDP